MGQRARRGANDPGEAKAVLAAERGFFVGPGSNPRLTAEHQKDEQITSTVRNFIKDDVQKDEAGILTVTECLARFQFVADEAEIELPVPKVLKSLVQKAVQELHQKGLRHDLVLPDGRCVIGWKGLRLRREVENAAETWTEIKQLAESGRSEDSAETNLFITLPEMDPTIASATRN
jgi:hypothetical protein